MKKQTRSLSVPEYDVKRKNKARWLGSGKLAMLGCVRLTGGVRVSARGVEGSSRARIKSLKSYPFSSPASLRARLLCLFLLSGLWINHFTFFSTPHLVELTSGSVVYCFIDDFGLYGNMYRSLIDWKLPHYLTLHVRSFWTSLQSCLRLETSSPFGATG